MSDIAEIKVYEEHYTEIIEHGIELKNLKEVQESKRNAQVEFDKTKKYLDAAASVGLMIGDVLNKLDGNRIIVKTSQGPRYIVGCKREIERDLLVLGTRVALDVTTLTIMKILPREINPMIHQMSIEKPGDVRFEDIGGLQEQIRELREVVELPLKNPEIFTKVGVDVPKGVLMYGPPGTGKTLLARAVASTLDVNFLKIVASSIIEKYIGESSRIIREMFAYARDHSPCIIFLDEIDAIGSKRTMDSSSSDREVQRTLIELLAQLDGFSRNEGVKVIMATNRPDILDPALLRPGRLDRRIEIPLPNDGARRDILTIYLQSTSVQDEIDINLLVKLTIGFNGADIRNIVTEAGFLAIREERDYLVSEDLIKSVRKIAGVKKLEQKMDYKI